MKKDPGALLNIQDIEKHLLNVFFIKLQYN